MLKSGKFWTLDWTDRMIHKVGAMKRRMMKQSRAELCGWSSGAPDTARAGSSAQCPATIECNEPWHLVRGVTTTTQSQTLLQINDSLIMCFAFYRVTETCIPSIVYPFLELSQKVSCCPLTLLKKRGSNNIVSLRNGKKVVLCSNMRSGRVC